LHTHSEQRVLLYRPEQIFDLVMDIERYPEFLPWCVAARILRRGAGELDAEVAIGFKGIRERFASRVVYDRAAGRVDVAYKDGPFHHLENHWVFEPEGEAHCRVDFDVAFSFRSRMLEALMGHVFGEAVRRMVGAFEQRAAVLYGPPKDSRRAAPSPSTLS
jgi:coenzyme Q-binding protein COQ10